MKKTNLAQEKCQPCQSKMPPIAIDEAIKILDHLHKDWSINGVGRLERIFLFNNFIEALNLAIELGTIAKKAEHYPELNVSYGKLRIEIWTHEINGLSRADFVLAAKFDEAVSDEKE
jgi:4a-hydroxytetrahydrobiopterin dehydratase